MSVKQRSILPWVDNTSIMGPLAKRNVIDLAFTHFTPAMAVGMTRPVKLAVVTLHGFLGCRRNLDEMNKSLAKRLGIDVYSVDQRNHGDSLKCTPYDYLTLTNDLIYFIKTHIGDRPISTIGFSSGAKIAMLSLLSKKINVSCCVSIDLPPYPTPALDDILRANYTKIMALIRGDILISKGASNWQENVLEEFRKMSCNTEDLAKYFAGGFNYNQVNNTMDKKKPYIEYTVPLQEMPDILESVSDWPNAENMDSATYNMDTSKPILFLKGLKSGFIRNDYRLLGKQFHNYSVKEFPTNHNILGESYIESIEAIEKFLATNI